MLFDHCSARRDKARFWCLSGEGQWTSETAQDLLTFRHNAAPQSGRRCTKRHPALHNRKSKQMSKPLYQILATTLEAAFNCERTGNTEWFGKHHLRLELLVKEYMPSGSGINAGTSLMLSKQKTGELRFGTSFQHMNSDGYYEGWTSHEIIVRPNLAHGFDLQITGQNKNGIKEYLGDIFHIALSQMIDSNAMMEQAHG
jgi:hypothetical protein